MSRVIGERCHTAKLTEAKVLEIREKYRSGQTVIDLASEYGVVWSSINLLVRGKSWKHLPLPGMPDSKATMRARLAKFSVPSESGCVLWAGGRSGASERPDYRYGRLRVNGRKVQAHRAVWELERGPIPAGAIVMHTCDTPLCLNIEHLRLGTQSDNVKDAVSKGRCGSIYLTHSGLLPSGVAHLRLGLGRAFHVNGRNSSLTCARSPTYRCTCQPRPTQPQVNN